MHQELRRGLAIALVTGPAFWGAAASGTHHGDDLAACRVPGQITVGDDGWARIAPPAYTPEEIGPTGTNYAAYAIQPHQKNVIYATNGETIKVTADSGCTWNWIWGGQLQQVAAPQVEHRPDIFTHLSAPSPTSLWVAGYDELQDDVERPRVYFGSGVDEDTRTFGSVDPGLPQYGRPVAFTTAPSDPQKAFLLNAELPDPRSGDPATAVNHLYVTYIPQEPNAGQCPPACGAADQIGLTWKEVLAPEGFGQITGVTASPLPDTVWIWSGTKYATTTGASAEDVVWHQGETARPITAIAIDPSGHAVIAGGATGYRVDRADGTIVKKLALPLVPTSMTVGQRNPESIVVSGADGTWGYDDRAQRWVDITPERGKPFSRLGVGEGETTHYVLGQRPEALFRFDTYRNETFLPTRDPLEGFGDRYRLPSRNIDGIELSPMRHTVTVAPGEIADVPVELLVGADPPNELDVFFLMDTTGSMTKAIDGLKEGVLRIAERLRHDLGKLACFGVGDFKDITATNAGQVQVNDVYRARQKIDEDVCKSDTEVEVTKAAIGEMKASGGGNDPNGAEAQTIALEQLVTGKGQLPYVAAGQNAGFRRNAYKVVVLITDAPFKRGANYPSIERVAEVLNKEAVKVVNIVVPSGENDLDEARRDLVEVATLTRSEAPDRGVDCDGDGRESSFDLSAGDPLVCEVNGDEPNIRDAVIGLLLGVTDPGTIGVEIYDDHHAVRPPIKGQTHAVRNLKRDSVLDFTMPVSCTTAQDGMDLPVYLQPNKQGILAGNIVGKVIVRCRAPKVPPPRIPPEEPVIEILVSKPRPPVAAAVQPPPQPPAQPISNINLNAGFSQQDEQQYQLAAVTQGAQEGDDGEEVELAMTGLDQPARDVGSAAGLLAGATAITAAAGGAYRRRLQRSVRIRQVRVR